MGNKLFDDDVMKKIFLSDDFDVEKASDEINAVMSRWSVHFIKIKAKRWKIYDYTGNVVCEICLDVDFNDMETRIRLEDLVLNIIHHIESLRDETTYTTQLVTEDLID